MYSAYYYYGHYATKFGKSAEGFHEYAQMMVTGFTQCTQLPAMNNR